ncbi:MAG: right-handed parallel beta-helix repeat-containing protein [Sedimentisphaerales bacterium]|nr:right-handed parallel beta-helix repeat-containing protein [Sedimentisphaerales bacterium]
MSEKIMKCGMVLIVLFCPLIYGKVIYVDDDASGANDGSSWENAYIYLQDALADANSAAKPVEIRVAQGVYKPDEGIVIEPEFNRRTMTFQLINGVALKGGYVGVYESDPNIRDVSLYETILSGDLDGNDIEVNSPSELEIILDMMYLEPDPSFLENSYHVVTSSLTDKTAVMDGFTITAGTAYGMHGGIFTADRGGGIYNYQGSPRVINCIFSKNVASVGGGMYNYKSSPILANCTFKDNDEGMHNYKSNPILSDCKFIGNMGGGMSNEESNLELTNCTFSSNLARYGGGMYNLFSNLILIECTFSGNVGHEGGGMHNDLRCSLTLVNCTFIENSTDRWGGGLNNFYTKDSILINCTFKRNSSSLGGGICNYMTNTYHGISNNVIKDCIFIENSADNGGGISNGGDSNPIVANCTFSRNSATQRGGGIFNEGSSPIITNCIFSSNSAEDGGGLCSGGYLAGIDGLSIVMSSNPKLTNCIFSGNSAIRGGGIYVSWESQSVVTNCTLTGNSAQDGYTLACDSYGQKYPSNLELTNCIVWDGENGIWNNDGSTITIRYSDIQGGWEGEGNINVDPLFAEPGYWVNDPNAVWVDGNYHLKSQAGRWDPIGKSWVKDNVTSRCIDAGDPNSQSYEYNGGRINMGAYGGTLEASKTMYYPK